jgi:hypothetical protein
VQTDELRRQCNEPMHVTMSCSTRRNDPRCALSIFTPKHCRVKWPTTITTLLSSCMRLSHHFDDTSLGIFYTQFDNSPPSFCHPTFTLNLHQAILSFNLHLQTFYNKPRNVIHPYIQHSLDLENAIHLHIQHSLNRERDPHRRDGSLSSQLLHLPRISTSRSESPSPSDDR